MSAKEPVDLLLVSLGTTLGLRASDDQFAELVREAGRTVHVARPPLPREVRTMALTDFVQARAARRVARQALRRLEPRAIVYSTTTAALLWPRRGAIRFDALAQVTRNGRDGLWQRPLERRRLAQATLLLPVDERSMEGWDGRGGPRAIVTPIAIRPSTAAGDAVGSHGHERIVAVTYGSDVHKKGLDRTLAAWARARRPGELLAVCGREDLPGGVPADGVLLAGRLPAADFRALVREAGVLVTAPRREDYGLTQIEALAEGARVVTTRAPGPYAALPVIERLWPQQVVGDTDDPAPLAQAIRRAVDAQATSSDAQRAIEAAAPWQREVAARHLATTVLPALGL